MSIDSSLWDVARAARSFLEPVWPEWHRARNLHPDIPSRGTCGRSSLFLLRVLERDCRRRAEWATGVPDAARNETASLGFFTGARWAAHSWVEIDHRWIVDITADQFDLPAIIVTAIGDPRYERSARDPASQHFRDARARTVEELWPAWLGSAQRAHLRAIL